MKKPVILVLIILAVVLSACSSEKEDVITEGGRESLPSVTATAEKTENKKEEEKTEEKQEEDAEQNTTGLTEADVLKLLKKDLSDGYLYEVAAVEVGDSYTYALFVKNRSEKESVPNVIFFDQSITGILLATIDNETKSLQYLFEGTAKDSLKQACLLRVEEEIYFLLNRQMNYIEWERFSLDTFVLDGSDMRQVYGLEEGDNRYEHWFSYKAELCADGTIELSKRADSYDSYNEYIHTFNHAATDGLTYEAGSAWELYDKESLDEFLSRQTWRKQSELAFESWSEVDILLNLRQSELFVNNEIDITYSQCAVLLKKDLGQYCLLGVKAKNDHHQAGFQNLIFTLYDKENSKFVTAKGFHGDFSDAYLFEADNEAYIASYTQTVYNGVPTAGGGVFKLQENDFVQVWPSEEDGVAVFDGKVAELTEDGRFLFSVLSWNRNEDGMLLDYELVPGETVSVSDVIKAEFNVKEPVFESNVKVRVGDGFAAYLDETGKIHIIYDNDGKTTGIDLEKKYIGFGEERSWLVVIDEEGKAWTSYPYTADEVDAQIYESMKMAADAGGNYGMGVRDPNTMRTMEALSEIKQLSCDYAISYCALLEDGTVFLHERGRGQELLEAFQGASQIAVAKWGGVAGIKEDGSFLFSNISEWTREAVLKKWTELELKQICGGDYFVGLKEDGTVIAEEGILNYRMNAIEQWHDIMRIAVGGGTVVGLKANGTVVAVCTPDTDKGQCNVDQWTDIVAVDTNGSVTVGMKKDGSIVYTGGIKK